MRRMDPNRDLVLSFREIVGRMTPEQYNIGKQTPIHIQGEDDFWWFESPRDSECWVDYYWIRQVLTPEELKKGVQFLEIGAYS